MEFTKNQRFLLVLAALLVAGVTLPGCRPEEQHRVLSYEKGHYLGKPDTKLSEAQRDALEQRTHQLKAF
jgi:hypothetical protein